MFDFLKRKKEPYDYGAAIAKLATLCQKSSKYSIVMPSVHYDTHKGKFCVHFECAEKEYTNGETRKKFFLTTRRDEKIFGEDLEALLDFAVTYAGYPDAFINPPLDNLPEGITMNVKNILRRPGEKLPSMPKWKLK